RRRPAPDEILVERIGRRAGGKALGIGRGKPVAAAVGGMKLVGQNDRALGVETEFVIGIDQDQPLPRRHLAAERKQRQRLVRNLAPLLFGQELARDDLVRAERRIMVALGRLGGGGNDRARELLVVAQPVLEAVAVHLTRAVLVHLQDRRGGGAGEII